MGVVGGFGRRGAWVPVSSTRMTEGRRHENGGGGDGARMTEGGVTRWTGPSRGRRCARIMGAINGQGDRRASRPQSHEHAASGQRGGAFVRHRRGDQGRGRDHRGCRCLHARVRRADVGLGREGHRHPRRPEAADQLPGVLQRRDQAGPRRGHHAARAQSGDRDRDAQADGGGAPGHHHRPRRRQRVLRGRPRSADTGGHPPVHDVRRRALAHRGLLRAVHRRAGEPTAVRRGFRGRLDRRIPAQAHPRHPSRRGPGPDGGGRQHRANVPPRTRKSPISASFWRGATRR